MCNYYEARYNFEWKSLRIDLEVEYTKELYKILLYSPKSIWTTYQFFSKKPQSIIYKKFL